MPIDGAVTVDVALANLGKIFAYIASIKMPDGVTLAGCARWTIVPPRYPCGAQVDQREGHRSRLTGDVRGRRGAHHGSSAVPKMARELGAAFGGDTTFFVVARSPATQSALGAIVYQEREAFRDTSYGPMDRR